MIPHFVKILEIGVVVNQTYQVFLTESQRSLAVKFVLEDDTSMEQSVLDDIVCSGFLGRRKRDLRQIVGALMWVVGVGGCCISKALQPVVSPKEVCAVRIKADGIVLLIHISNNRLVEALPVVFILTFSPLPLKRCFALGDGDRIIEIPFAIALLDLRCRWLLRGVWVCVVLLLLYLFVFFCL